MAANAYHLVTTWRVEGTVAEVNDVIGDAAGLAAWWPAAFLSVEMLEAGGAKGIGKRLEVWTKGWLPYTLRWRQTVIESREPFGFTIDAEGDFAGRGVWTFRQEGAYVDVNFDWRIDADKTLLRLLSPILKPLFAFNHRWAMARGEEGLKLELVRRRAATPEARAAVPPPPGPTWPHRRGSAHPGAPTATLPR